MLFWVHFLHITIKKEIMYCRCINNDRIDKSFIVGNIYEFSVDDDNWVTVYDSDMTIMLGIVTDVKIHIKDFIMSFQRI